MMVFIWIQEILKFFYIIIILIQKEIFIRNFDSFIDFAIYLASVFMILSEVLAPSFFKTRLIKTMLNFIGQ